MLNNNLFLNHDGKFSECFDSHCLILSSQYIYQIGRENVVITIFLNMRKCFQKDWMTCPGLQAGRTWFGNLYYPNQCILLFLFSALKIFKIFYISCLQLQKYPIVTIRDNALFFPLDTSWFPVKYSIHIKHSRSWMHRSECENVNFCNEESVMPYWSYWQKKPRQLGWKAQTWDIPSCGQCKQHIKNVPKNRGEIHISVNNNRKVTQ